MAVRSSVAPNRESTELEPRALLERLEHRERQVTRLWERLVERVALFPNPASVRQHEEAVAERERLRGEIAELRAQVDVRY